MFKQRSYFFGMIRSWQLSRLMTQPLKLISLQQAGQQSVPGSCHSDQGVQSLLNDYVSTLTDYGVEISLTHRGGPWENGYAERRPTRTLKEEEVHLNDYDDIADAKTRIGHFIENVYNQKRPHSALGYLTPIEFEQKTCLNYN